MKIIIAGGTGFVGRAVAARFLSAGHEVVLLSRQARELSPDLKAARQVVWDAATPGSWRDAFEGADAVIDLCGENISAGPWTPQRKEKLRQSRLVPTRLIVEAIGACLRRPRVLINASAVGYYGDAGDVALDEGSGVGHGFLAELCADWERAALQAQQHGVRVIVARIGVVLGDGGVLGKLVLPFRLFAGGPLGSGRQWMSWVERQDLAEIFFFMLFSDGLKGPVNCVAPQPVRMDGFCALLGSALGRPSWLRCPAFVLRALLGEMADVLLFSQRVTPLKLVEAGFVFQRPRIQDALAFIMRSETVL